MCMNERLCKTLKGPNDRSIINNLLKESIAHLKLVDVIHYFAWRWMVVEATFTRTQMGPERMKFSYFSWPSLLEPGE